MIKPEYAENIIVGISINNSFKWYILNKFLCLLNLKNLSSEEIELYMRNDLCRSIRKDFLIIDTDNIELFLQNIKKYMVNCESLQLLILDGLKDFDNFEIDDFFPVLYFDFDKKIVYSQYPEYFDFESFLPEKWSFIYDDFSDLLEDADKYWIYKSQNIFDRSTQKLEELRKKSKEKKYTNLFKKQTISTNSSTTGVAIVEYKETIVTKIRKWIKRFF